MDYKRMFRLLFKATANAVDVLISAHHEIDEIIMETDDTPITLSSRPEPEE